MLTKASLCLKAKLLIYKGKQTPRLDGVLVVTITASDPSLETLPITGFGEMVVTPTT